ncbi:hypothetical protein LBW62_23860 [Ralstonia solanacearum]|uniref:hypothetical protein n=1 Tax=Ralstonia solanacearum TaxID=305 RepID=UPI000A5447E9|nr:hypothetical protein [Ralstonia solanacearum]MDB0544258.1 hypothetical protein [Ralstonia solanacearum]MDB0554133.1 hypothetical protein [Ralstonia solanacearum]MDB0559210.1 hypothetical protein [Ralstonia solanacearum]
MSTPQIAIQRASSTCATIARSLLAHAEMLQVARPDSEIVRQAQISLRRLSVELSNAGIGLGRARLIGEDDE